MNKKQAAEQISKLFQNAFNRDAYTYFLQNLLNEITPGSRQGHRYSGAGLPSAYKHHINQYWCLGKYIDPNGTEVDLQVVEVNSLSCLDRARSKLRNFAVDRLLQFNKDYGLFAFYAKEDNGCDWRFSYVKIEHTAKLDKQSGKVKLKKELTPAKRYSFLVGKHENSHTAQAQLVDLLAMDYANPSVEEIEKAFSIEKVTKEFFEQYKDLFVRLSEVLVEQAYFQQETDSKKRKQIVAKFAKKLLGQIVFLYFLQKKGWLGVKDGEAWGKGERKFLQKLFIDADIAGENYYVEKLQYLFYEALANDRKDQFDPSYYKKFDCKIPFLNGGLFEADYDWQKIRVEIPNTVFSNNDSTKVGDKGNGILDVFDRYNFTIKEDEPLEKEVAVDPEMLGKVFENMLEITERKSKGAFYTPREIVHYMCQESLIHYLHGEVCEKTEKTIPKADIETLVRKGIFTIENDQRILEKGMETDAYNFKLPESIRENAILIDEKLSDIKVCDPAVGSGAFPVGMLHEIVNARRALKNHLSPDIVKKRKRIIQDNITKHVTYQYYLKKHTIAHSIYGVDIDSSAIDIARLRLWLSLVVDEEDYTSIDALPNLDYKIMQGNSLIEEYEGVKLFDEHFIEPDNSELLEKIAKFKTDIKQIQDRCTELHRQGTLTPVINEQSQKEISKKKENITKWENKVKASKAEDDFYDPRRKAQALEQLHTEFFSINSPAEKRKKRKEITSLEWQLIEATLAEQNKKDALAKLAEYKTSGEKPWFLWKLNFSEVFKQKEGFDIVIGNPPYGVSIKGEMRNAVEKFFGKVPDYEIYYFFIELSRYLLRHNGINSFIIPNTLLFNVFAAKYREKLLQEWQIHEILDCTAFKLFEKAVVRNMIHVIEKKEGGPSVGYRNTAGITLIGDLLAQNREYIVIKDLLKMNQNWGLAFKLGSKRIAVIDKIKQDSLTLISEGCAVSQGLIAYDKYRGQSEAIIKSRAYHFDEYKPGLKKWILGEDITRFQCKWNGVHYIDYCDGIANPRKPIFFTQERVLVREITNPTIFACMTSEELYNDPSVLIILPSKVIKCSDLVTILNSDLASFYHFNASPKATKGDFPKILIKDLNDFPIKAIDHLRSRYLSKLCRYQSFLAHMNSHHLYFSYIDELINGLVYELYFPEEIQAAGKEILPHLGELTPLTDDISQEAKLAVIEQEFERLYDPNHPVRNHLETLDSVEEVHIIREALKK